MNAASITPTPNEIRTFRVMITRVIITNAGNNAKKSSKCKSSYFLYLMLSYHKIMNFPIFHEKKCLSTLKTYKTLKNVPIDIANCFDLATMFVALVDASSN